MMPDRAVFWTALATGIDWLIAEGWLQTFSLILCALLFGFVLLAVVGACWTAKDWDDSEKEEYR